MGATPCPVRRWVRSVADPRGVVRRSPWVRFVERMGRAGWYTVYHPLGKTQRTRPSVNYPTQSPIGFVPRPPPPRVRSGLEHGAPRAVGSFRRAVGLVQRASRPRMAHNPDVALASYPNPHQFA